VSAVFAVGAVATAFGLIARDDETPRASNEYRGSEPPSGLRLPSFTLRDYTGRLVRSSDLRGEVVLVTFLDSQCTEACPLIAAQIGRTLAGLPASGRSDVEAIAISTDPAEDSAANVSRFLRRQRALQIRYLTRPEAAIRSVWRSFKILSSLESGRDTLHSAPVRIYDRQGFWVSTLHAGVDLTPANLAHDIALSR
jgi:cytochrome oxidase Cu insertion factor (SCO1/SenC/PrrC family)